MSSKRHSLKRLLYSFLHGIWMLLLTFYWLSMPYTFGDETFLIKWTSLVKKELFGFDQKPSPQEVLLVDVSASKTTIESEDLFGKSKYNRRIITDRQQISDFLAMLIPYKDELQLVLVDILFEDATPYDSLLTTQFDTLGQKILGISHLENGDSLVQPIFDIPTALATYRSSNDLFLKYPLKMKDTLKTVPLVLLEKLEGVEYKKWAGLNWIDGKLSLPSPLVDFKIRNTDLEMGSGQQDSTFTVYDLGTLFGLRDILGEAAMLDFFKNRVILVGDYVNDIHDTPFEKMAGILILYNAYLTLAEGGNWVTIWWMLFLVLGYTLMSYRVFTNQKVGKSAWLAQIFQSNLGQFILNALDEALILAIITIISYFLFNIHINILILLVYIKSVEYLWRFMKDKRKNKGEEPILE